MAEGEVTEVKLHVLSPLLFSLFSVTGFSFCWRRALDLTTVSGLGCWLLALPMMTPSCHASMRMTAQRLRRNCCERWQIRDGCASIPKRTQELASGNER